MKLRSAHTWPSSRLTGLSRAEAPPPVDDSPPVDHLVGDGRLGGLSRRLAASTDQVLRDAASVRAPEVGGLPLAAGGPLDMSTYGWQLVPPGELADGPTLRGDRFGLGLAQPLPVAGQTLAASLYPDTAELRLQGAPSGGGGIAHALALQLQPHTLIPTLAASRPTLAHAVLGLGLGLRIEGQHRLTLTAPHPEGACAEETLRWAVGPQLAGGLGHIGGGLTVPWLGVGGRWSRLTGSRATLRRPLATPELARWAGAPSAGSVLGGPASMARAWGLMAPLLAWPDPHHLEVGDSLTFSFDQGGHGGVGLALLGVLAGRYSTWHREDSLQLRRLAPHVLEATVRRERQSGDAWALEMPLLGDWHAGRDEVVAIGETFRFATDVAAGRQAYQLVLAGALPDGADRVHRLLAGSPDDGALSALARALGDERLPAGVQRGPLVWSAAPAQLARGGAVATPAYLPAPLARGQGRELRLGRTYELVADRGELALTERWARQRDTRLWAGGGAGDQIWAQRRRRLVALTLGARPRELPVEHAAGLTLWHAGRGGAAASRALLAATPQAAAVPSGELPWRLSLVQPLPAAARRQLAGALPGFALAPGQPLPDDGWLGALAAHLAADPHGGVAALSALHAAVSPLPIHAFVAHPEAAPLVAEAEALALGLRAAQLAGSLTLAQLGEGLGGAGKLAGRIGRQRAALRPALAALDAGHQTTTELAGALDRAAARLGRLSGAVAQLDARLDALWRGEAAGPAASWGLSPL